jgi:hypothetical protein
MSETARLIILMSTGSICETFIAGDRLSPTAPAWLLIGSMRIVEG